MSALMKPHSSRSVTLVAFVIIGAACGDSSSSTTTTTPASNPATSAAGSLPLDSLLAATPAQVEGPYYPPEKPQERDFDLTVVGDSTTLAAGDRLFLSGLLVRPDGSPIAGATVEIWQVDANGNHLSSKVLSSYEVASMESTFGIDLNANGFIGSYLGQDAAGYTLGQSVTLKLNGNQVGSSSFAGWSALAAAATVGGNQVAWRNSDGGFGIWNTDLDGNYQTGMAVNNVQIGAYENLFAEDLNGNGILDSLRTIESFGTTSVKVDLNGGYAFSSEKGVQLLQLNGQQVSENFAGSWNVVGAQDTVTGYQVILKESGTGANGYWNTDASGNYLAGKVIDGSQLQAFETSFQQDLDASGTGALDPITNQMVDGLTAVEEVGSASQLQQDNGGYVIDGANGIQFLNYRGTQVTPGFSSDWTLNGVETQGSGYAANWTRNSDQQTGTWSTNSTGDYLSAALG